LLEERRFVAEGTGTQVENRQPGQGNRPGLIAGVATESLAWAAADRWE
jgi:hypothetical protein